MKKVSTSQPSWLIRDRIKELRRVKASLLVPNPKNWRIHGKQQAAALKGLLREMGYADALLARELPDGKLMLIDGHLRAETTPLQEVPVLTASECHKAIGTLAGQPTTNSEILADPQIVTDPEGYRSIRPPGSKHCALRPILPPSRRNR